MESTLARCKCSIPTRKLHRQRSVCDSAEGVCSDETRETRGNTVEANQTTVWSDGCQQKVVLQDGNIHRGQQ